MYKVWFTALQALFLVGNFNAETTKSILFHAGASSVSMYVLRPPSPFLPPSVQALIVTRQRGYPAGLSGRGSSAKGLRHLQARQKGQILHREIRCDRRSE